MQITAWILNFYFPLKDVVLCGIQDSSVYLSVKISEMVKEMMRVLTFPEKEQQELGVAISILSCAKVFYFRPPKALPI